MATFNSCANLTENLKQASEIVEKHLGNGGDLFQLILEMQDNLQANLAQRLPQNGNVDPFQLKETATCGELVDHFRLQKDSIDDEFRELLTAFGGMSNGESAASAVWKRWKSDYQQKRNVKFSELSESDQLEVKFELVDIVHFVAIMINALNISSRELTELYVLKNLENVKRYTNNY